MLHLATLTGHARFDRPGLKYKQCQLADPKFSEVHKLARQASKGVTWPAADSVDLTRSLIEGASE